MKKPLIGIVPLVDEARESYWMLPGYMQGVEQAGGVARYAPLTDDTACTAAAGRYLRWLFADGRAGCFPCPVRCCADAAVR